MKALRTKICTYVIALLVSCSFATTSMAGSDAFTGIYGAFTGTAGGAQIDGSHTDRGGQISKGQVGGVFPMAGYEIGFNLPLGDLFFLGVGHSWSKAGTASIADADGDSKGGGGLSGSVGSDGQAAADSSFHLKAKNLKEVYIMPSISIYDNSAIYVKLGRAIADTEFTGNATGIPGNLTGDLIGFGTIAMTDSGIFVKTEGSVTRFDDIEIIGVGGSSAKIEGTPDVVAGTIAIGFKF
jgi:hypothetical protein